MWPQPQRGRANSTPHLSEPALDLVLICNFRDKDEDVKGTMMDCFKIQNEVKINLDSWSDAQKEENGGDVKPCTQLKAAHVLLEPRNPTEI